MRRSLAVNRTWQYMTREGLTADEYVALAIAAGATSREIEVATMRAQCRTLVDAGKALGVSAGRARQLESATLDRIRQAEARRGVTGVALLWRVRVLRPVLLAVARALGVVARI